MKSNILTVATSLSSKTLIVDLDKYLNAEKGFNIEVVFNGEKFVLDPEKISKFLLSLRKL